MAKNNKTVKVIEKEGSAGFVLFLAWIGAFVYFMQGAVGFSGLIIALLKALVWPAYLVYYVLQFLGV